jgi:hypothetical protein
MVFSFGFVLECLLYDRNFGDLGGDLNFKVAIFGDACGDLSVASRRPDAVFIWQHWAAPATAGLTAGRNPGSGAGRPEDPKVADRSGWIV